MPTLNDFFTAVLEEIETPAKELFKDFVKDAKADAEAFLEESKEDLELWTKQLARGEIDKDEFEDLVKGQSDLAKLEALRNAGILAAKLKRFRTKLIDVVISTAFKVFV